MHGISADSEWTTLLVGFLVAGVGVGITNPGSARRRSPSCRWRSRAWGRGSTPPSARSGIATGVAGLGAIFQSQVNSKLAEELPRLPQGLGGGLGEIVASSGSRGVEALRLPPALNAKAVHAADVAFVGAFNEIILIAAILSFVGAGLGFALTRSSSFVQSTGA